MTSSAVNPVLRLGIPQAEEATRQFLVDSGPAQPNDIRAALAAHGFDGAIASLVIVRLMDAGEIQVHDGLLCHTVALEGHGRLPEPGDRGQRQWPALEDLLFGEGDR